MTARAERSVRAARDATVSVCGPGSEHKGQGLLLRLGGAEGTLVLTCYHVVAAVGRNDLEVRLPLSDGSLGEPIEVTYDTERSRPEQDAAVLRIRSDAALPATIMPLLHKLGADTYEGDLRATVLTRLTPDNFDATVRPSTWIDVRADSGAGWPETPERYRLRIFRLAGATYSRPGFSGGVVFCEGGVLGLAHFGRGENEHSAREDYMVPLYVWAQGWPALEDLIEPLADRRLRGAATVKRGMDLSAGLGADVIVAGYRPEVYEERDVDALAWHALDERGGVVVVGRPLSGKSRLIIELLREDPRCVVVIPRPHSPAPPEGFEASGFAGEEVVVLFDDLHRTAGTFQTLAWLRAFEEATDRPCKVVCTSRDGTDWRQVETEQGRLLQELGKEATVFVSRVGEPGRQRGEDLSAEQGGELAEKLGMSAAEFRRRFEGTPGSLLLDLDDMRRRYEGLRDDDRGGVAMSRLLDSVKLLYRARLPMLPHPLVRAVAERVRGSEPVDQETWEALIRRTRGEGFAEVDEDTGDIRYYAPYLEQCVLYEPSRRDLEHLLPLVEEAQDVVGLFFLVALYGHDLKDYEGALVLAKRAIELDPSFAPSWYNKSYSLNHLGRNQEALEAIEQAISLDPEYHPSYYSRAWALNHLGRNEEALESFREALKRDEGTYPGATSMYLDGLSAALDDLGRFYEAVSAGVRSTALYPPYPPAASRICNLLCREGEPAYALEVAEGALTVDAKWPEAWYGKGLAFDELGQHKEALEAYDRATNLQRDLPQVWARKGVVFMEMSDQARGSDRLAKAIGEEQLDARAHTLAQLALDAIDTAIASGHDSVENRMNRALALSRLGLHDQALKAVDGALELEPNNPGIHHNKGMICLKARRYDEALNSFEYTTQLAPSFPLPWWPMVLLLGGTFDRQQAALFSVNQYTRLRPGPLAWFARGCILFKLGRSLEARFWLQHARGREGVLPLPGSPDGKRRSAFDFLGPENP